MVAEVFAGLTALKTAFDIARGLKDIDDATRRHAAIIELQEKILAAQSEQASLVERVGELKSRVAQLEAWDRDKARYQLTDIGGGGGLHAYTLRPGMENGEPPHNLKSILQPEARSPGRCDVLACNRCGSDLYLSGAPDPEHFKNRRRGR
jgi:hypothetical protein